MLYIVCQYVVFHIFQYLYVRTCRTYTSKHAVLYLLHINRTMTTTKKYHENIENKVWIFFKEWEILLVLWWIDGWWWQCFLQASRRFIYSGTYYMQKYFFNISVCVPIYVYSFLENDIVWWLMGYTNFWRLSCHKCVKKFNRSWEV